MREPAEKHIEEHVYRVRPMVPTKVLQTAPILGRLFLPALGKLVGGAASGAGSIGDVLESDLSGVDFGGAAQVLMAAWDQPQIDMLVSELAKTTEVCIDGNKWPRLADIFDVHFSGRTKEMLGWLAFAVEVQYGDFFGGLRGAVGRAQALKGSQSPSTSAGQSGE